MSDSTRANKYGGIYRFYTLLHGIKSEFIRLIFMKNKFVIVASLVLVSSFPDICRADLSDFLTGNFHDLGIAITNVTQEYEVAHMAPGEISQIHGKTYVCKSRYDGYNPLTDNKVGYVYLMGTGYPYRSDEGKLTVYCGGGSDLAEREKREQEKPWPRSIPRTNLNPSLAQY